MTVKTIDRLRNTLRNEIIGLTEILKHTPPGYFALSETKLVNIVLCAKFQVSN